MHEWPSYPNMREGGRILGQVTAWWRMEVEPQTVKPWKSPGALGLQPGRGLALLLVFLSSLTLVPSP